MPDYTTYPLGIDVSFWQGDIDWRKVSTRAKFAFIKAGQDIFPDAKFLQNWTNSKDKLPRGAYWFYDWRQGAKPTQEQSDKMRGLVDPPGELPPVMDFENPYAGWSTTPFPARDIALDLIRRFRDGLQVTRMLLYMNSSTLRTLLPYPDWLVTEFDLWIAAYPLIKYGTTYIQPRTPAEIPQNWIPSTYGWQPKFWQFTSKLDGTLFGVGSKDLDGDLFMGTEAEFIKYTGIKTLSDSEKLKRLVDAHPELFPEYYIDLGNGYGELRG